MSDEIRIELRRTGQEGTTYISVVPLNAFTGDEEWPQKFTHAVEEAGRRLVYSVARDLLAFSENKR